MTSSAPPPLRLGVVGCGRVFERFHLPAIVRIPTIELVAACDPDPSRLRWATHQTHYATPAELLNHPGLDAILILTPPAHHAEAAVRALDSGLHVLVEKPMALNRAEGRRMVQAAHRAGRRLQVGFSRRYREPYRRLRAALQGVDRSQLRTARFELSFPTSSWGAHTDFLGNEAQGGGVFDDVLSHQVDLIGWLLGTPNEVRAETDPSAEAIVSADLRLDSLTVSCRAAHGPPEGAERKPVGRGGREFHPLVAPLEVVVQPVIRGRTAGIEGRPGRAGQILGGGGQTSPGSGSPEGRQIREGAVIRPTLDEVGIGGIESDQQKLVVWVSHVAKDHRRL